MKIYEDRIIPEKTIEQLKTRKCDLCGVEANGEDWEAKSFYAINETEIVIEARQKEGHSYPEGGSGTKYEIDLCPDCFKNKLIPWLKSQGANIQKEDWGW